VEVCGRCLLSFVKRYYGCGDVCILHILSGPIQHI
jgi:hypothetical protein